MCRHCECTFLNISALRRTQTSQTPSSEVTEWNQIHPPRNVSKNYKYAQTASYRTFTYQPALISFSSFCTVSNPNPRLSLHSQQICPFDGFRHPHLHPPPYHHLHHHLRRRSNSTNQNTTIQHHHHTHDTNPLHHATNRSTNPADLSAATRISIHFRYLGGTIVPSISFHYRSDRTSTGAALRTTKLTLLLASTRNRERRRERKG
jgi:hypothetical protein